METAGPGQARDDCRALLATLREAGAGRFDPVRWHYIEALERRAQAQRGGVRRMLDARLAQALSALEERFELARREAAEEVRRCAAAAPQAAAALESLLAAGAFQELHRHIAALETGKAVSALAALVRELEASSGAGAEAPAHARAGTRPGARPELKTLRDFRNTWARLSVDNQVAQALKQAPRNAGPINSHMLMLRSLTMMRDISPDYLSRFMTYADTLLCLDRCETGKPETPARRKTTKAAKK